VRRRERLARAGRASIVTAMALASATAVFAGERLTLEQAVSEALGKNAGLLAEKANISIAEARILTARLRPNPVFSTSADHLDALGTGFSEINGGGPAEYSARVDFPIERGGKRRLRTEVAQLARSTTELLFQNAVRSVALDVANQFIDAQVAQASLKLARENFGYFEEIVRVNQARLKAGDIAEVELLRSRLALLQQRNVLREAESRSRAAVIRLGTAIGRGVPSPALELAGDLRHDTQPPTEMQVREAALRERPDLLAARRDLARAGTEVQSQMAQAKVDPVVGSEYRRQQGVNGEANTAGVFLAVPLPVFNRNQGEIERARQEQRQTELRVRQLETLIAGEVGVAHEQMLTARSLLQSIEGEMLTQAVEVRRVTEFSYRRGHVTLLELLDAQRAYNETVQGHIEARAQYARSLYALDAVGGRTVTQ
jgi:outer membrane protein, heavy metal efflux system